MKMIVHTSLSSLGYVAGGAEALLNALCNAVERTGLVVIPTFTYGRVPFDPAASRPVIGRVPEAAAFHAAFSRSSNPTHSFAVSGDAAPEIASRHALHDPIGETSPLYHLYENGGRVLLLGVDHRSNTSIHVAEYLANVPYGSPAEALLAMSTGYRTVQIAWRPGCSEAFQRAEEDELATPGRVAGRVGDAAARLIPIRPFVDAVAERLRREPQWLLGHCAWCTGARARISVAG